MHARTVSTLIVAAAATPAFGQFDYDLDSLISHFNIDVTVLGSFLMQEQLPGSLTAPVDGSLTVFRDGPQMIMEGNGAAENSGTYDPGPAPGNIGFFVDLDTLGTVSGAVRGLGFSLQANGVGSFNGPMSNGSFSVPLVLTLTSGTIELGATGDLAPTLDGFVYDLTGRTAEFTATGTTTHNGNIEMLSMPLDFDLVVDDPTDLTLGVTGSLDGSRIIPAPASVVIFAAGLAGCARRRRV